MNSKYLREELIKSTDYYCKVNNIIDVVKSNSGVTIFKGSKQNFNFIKESYENILNKSEWIKRLSKPHTFFPKNSGIAELDSSMSSDALLMNIFCHPKIKELKGIRKLLQLDNMDNIEFGYKPGVLKKDGTDETEIDMKINDTLFEAKLTEGDFQKKNKSKVLKYRNFENIFHLDKLEQSELEYYNYQLIRNILAIAQNNNYNFILLCDMRRPDLIRSFQHTVSCIKEIELRQKCGFVTWQEIAHYCNKDLKEFLNIKYGL